MHGARGRSLQKKSFCILFFAFQPVTYCGFESGGHPLMNSLPRAPDPFWRICRAVEVANFFVKKKSSNLLHFTLCVPSAEHSSIRR
jgi:hypothetical protein